MSSSENKKHGSVKRSKAREAQKRSRAREESRAQKRSGAREESGAQEENRAQEQVSARDIRSVRLLLGGFCALTVLVLTLCLTAVSSRPDTLSRALTEAEVQEITQRNSPLTEYILLSPNADFPRADEIRKITIHHMAGNMSLEALGDLFSDRDRRSSASYGIDSAGRVGLYVEEGNRPWTSSSRENDHQAVTIEVANDETGGDWHVSDAAYETLIALCADVCRRNGIPSLTYTGDETGTLTIHKMFNPETECPGPYLESRMADIAEAVNRRLSG